MTLPPADLQSWALVTGACSGIGLEIARDLARRGYGLVLVSDRTTELQEAAHTLELVHSVTAHCVTMDLACPKAARELYEQTRALGVDIDVLVSNAGMLFFGEVADADPIRADAMLQLHVTTPSLLAVYFGRDMRQRRRGHMVFVSSASTWRDFPGIAFYGSSKRYLRSFAASLREELRPWGVTVTCLAPGAVATNLYDAATGPARVAHRMRLLTDPARVARAAIRGALRGKATVFPGWSARLMAVGATLTPRWVIRLVQDHTQFLPGPRGEEHSR